MSNNVLMGKIATPPSHHKTSTGKEYIDFGLMNKQILVLCRIWSSSCDGWERTNLIKPDKEITVRGFYGNGTSVKRDIFSDYKGQQAQKEFIVNWFKVEGEEDTPAAKKESFDERLWAWHGGEMAWKENLRKFFDEARDKGLVPAIVPDVPGCQLIKREDAVKLDGKYVPKITYASLVLGGEYVTKVLREFLKDTRSSILGLNIDRKKYLKVLEALVEEADEKRGVIYRNETI
jgi:hypothetical protein